MIKEIPSEIGFMTALLDLDFSKNLLSSTLPSELGLLARLTFLDLKENALTGNVEFTKANLTAQ